MQLYRSGKSTSSGHQRFVLALITAFHILERTVSVLGAGSVLSNLCLISTLLFLLNRLCMRQEKGEFRDVWHSRALRLSVKVRLPALTLTSFRLSCRIRNVHHTACTPQLRWLSVCDSGRGLEAKLTLVSFTVCGIRLYMLNMLKLAECAGVQYEMC